MGSALFRNLRFLGIPKTLALALALAQVGTAISTVGHWGTVEMAAPTWASAKGLGLGLGLGLDRIQRVCMRTFRSALCFLGIPRKRSAFCRKRRFLKSAEHIYGTCKKSVQKTVRFICIARHQHFPKNGIKQSVPFRYIFSLSHHITTAYSQSVTVFFPCKCKHGLFSVSCIRGDQHYSNKALRET